VSVCCNEMPPNNGLRPTRLSPPKIGGLTRFQSVLQQRLSPALAARVKPTVSWPSLSNVYTLS